MRLTIEYRNFFKTYWTNILSDSKVFLFGSRVDDNKKGGDIDLLILSNSQVSIEQKMKFISRFYITFGEQKIDIVTFTYSEETTFKKIALSKAIEL